MGKEDGSITCKVRVHANAEAKVGCQLIKELKIAENDLKSVRKLLSYAMHDGLFVKYNLACCKIFSTLKT